MTSRALRGGIVDCDESAQPFYNLSTDLTDLIARISSTAIYCRKAKLFVEGQKPCGVFVLRTGKAKLTTCSALGKTIIARFGGPGDVLGLNAVVSGRPYGATAEMMAAGRVDFIPHHSLLQLMGEHHDLALVVAEQLSVTYYRLHDAIRSLGLGTHPLERLAKLLLSWTNASNEDIVSRDYSFELPLTHQEIADSIGSTRETVSKLFSELKRKHLVRSEGGALTITDPLELQRIVRF